MVSLYHQVIQLFNQFIFGLLGSSASARHLFCFSFGSAVVSFFNFFPFFLFPEKTKAKKCHYLPFIKLNRFRCLTLQEQLSSDTMSTIYAIF